MAVIDKIKSALHKDGDVHAAAPEETGLNKDAPPVVPTLPDQAAFDDKHVTVIFVLGGPGAGELPWPVLLIVANELLADLLRQRYPM